MGRERGRAVVVEFSGPVGAGARAELEAAGARVVGSPGGCALVAEVPAGAEAAVRAVPGVSGLSAWGAERRVSRRLREAAAAEPERVAKVFFQTFVPEDAPGVARRLAAAGASEAAAVPARSRHGLVTARIALGAAVEAAARTEGVAWAEEAVPERVCNELARSAENLSSEVAQELGLDGAGEIVGVADTGFDTGDPATLHPDLEGRILAAFARGREGDWSDPAAHGTHVAGSLAGTGAASGGLYRGMAPGARLVVQSLSDAKGALQTPDDLAELFEEAYLLGARIHSDSWGADVRGEYTLRAQQADEYVWNHPDLLVVAAAGNAGVDGDRDGFIDPGSVGSPASAKNVLAVGAAESGREPGSGGRTADTYGNRWPLLFPADPIASDLISTPPEGAPRGLAAFSSRGPTLDGRIKPDVVGPGTDVVSLRSRASDQTAWGILAANTNYLFSGGTSMATPLVSGAAAQLRQWARLRHGIASPSAALLKAALAGGARSLAPGQYGEGESREIPPRPSAAEGHGLVDVAASVLPGGGTVAVMREGPEPLATGGEAEYAFEIAEPGLPLGVALAWSDAPALAGVSPALVNDLDLRLVAPDGAVWLPAGAPNRLDNLERVDVAAAATGRWTAVVAAWNVPDGPQPYALWLRGAIRTPLDIVHVPLQNQSATASTYRVSATISADGAWDASTARLHWRRDGGPWQSVSLAAAAPALPVLPATEFSADIPAAPLGAVIDYRLTADGVEAPEELDAFWTFRVAADLSLAVAAEGAPEGAPPCEPPCGVHAYPSGTVVRATSPAVVDDPDAPGDRRTACIGWSGTGSVPAGGGGAVCEFTLEEPSSLAWIWQRQVSLREVSEPAGLFPVRLAWWPLGAADAATSAPVPEIVENPDGGAPWVFADWRLDGERWPDAATPATPAGVSGIPMDDPRTLAARYLPADLDADADGLPDWFSARHFPSGGSAAAPSADPDGDGWENAIEAADYTDPLDPASFPAPPAIAHVPVASPVTSAVPLRIEAAVTDNCAVASATLRLRRNGMTARAFPMVRDPADPTRWTVLAPAAAADGDDFVYSIAATDAAGLLAETPEYAFSVRWPGLSAPFREGFHFDLSTLDGPAAAVATAALTFANTGSVPLAVEFAFAPVGFADDAESGPGGWTTAVSTPGAPTSTWHIADVPAFSHSPSHAWCNGVPDWLPTYRCHADDALVSPPVRLWPADAPRGGPPRLAFWHWAAFENDDSAPATMYDSARLEASAGPDAPWLPLDPEGGYPAVMAYTVSAFPEGTPCFASTDDAWLPVSADLSALAPTAEAAAAPVRLRFRFASDPLAVSDGWRIDDLEIAPRTLLPDTAPPGATNWASLSADSLRLDPGESATVLLRVDASGLGPMQTDYLLLDLRHNDPRLPSPLPIPVSLARTDRRLTVTSEGPGAATPSGTFFLPAPALDGFSLSFAPDPGAILADLALDGVPVPDLCGADAPVELSVSLASNLDVHATFAVPPAADQLPPADWLAAWGLTNRPPLAEAALDPDRDGLLTWQEAALGSDPTDPASAPLRLALLPPAGTDTAFRVVWHAYTNPAAAYTLLSATNPLGPYLPLHDLPAAPPVMTSPPLPPSPAFHGLLYRP